MVIKGSGVNTFAAMNNTLQKKTNASPVSGTPFAKRFDTFVLSDLFKKYVNAKGNDDDISAIQKMLSETNNNLDKQTVAGTAGLIYMQGALAQEMMYTAAVGYQYAQCTEEKAYYQSLLNEADEISTSASVPTAQDHFEYKCPDGGEIDREEAEKALANVQSRIDSFINNNSDSVRKPERNMEIYNKCASTFASAFDVDKSDVVLDEEDHNKLFGEINADEKSFLQKCKDKMQDLRDRYSSLDKLMEDSIKKMRSESGGEKRAASIKKAINELSFGNSYNDILSLIDEFLQVKEEQTKNF